MRQVPYRLPELIEAVALGKTVFVVEGERDVDRLAALSVPATTNAGGAGKWRLELTAFFDGASVVIIPDNDPQKTHPKTGAPMFHPDGRPVLPGQDHGAAVARALALVARVRVLDLAAVWPDMPLKGDVSDWLDRGGGSAEALYELAERMPLWSPGIEPADEPAQRNKSNGAEPHDRGAPPIGDAVDEPALPQLELFDVGDEDGKIEPREWLLGTTFCRRNLSGLISAGAGGKTTVRILQLLSAACDRSLTGEHVFVRCRVLIVCLEDDMKELRRRVRAAMLHHNVTPAEVKGFLFLTTPRGLKIARRNRETGAVTKAGLYHALVKLVDDLKLDILCIDPAVKAHSLNENDNAEIDAFASILTDLAAHENIAIDMLSHERKGVGSAGDVNRGRGAGSGKDAARLMRTLTGMSEDDAKALGVDEDERAYLVRLDNAKVNIAPPARAATWFHLVGVNIGNGTEAYPHGDNVQTVELWKPTALFEGMPSEDLNWVLRKLGVGMGDGRRYSAAPAAKDRAAWLVVKERFPDLVEVRCRAIITTWAQKQLLETGEYDDPKRPEKATGILSTRLIGDTEWGEE